MRSSHGVDSSSLTLALPAALPVALIAALREENERKELSGVDVSFGLREAEVRDRPAAAAVSWQRLERSARKERRGGGGGCARAV